MDVLIWSIKGYTGINLTKEKLNKKKYSFDEIKESDPNIIKEIEDNLEKNGLVLALLKKKIIKAIYIFKITKKGDERILTFDKKIVLDEVNKCVKEFEHDIGESLPGILINRRDIDKIIWKEKELTQKETFKSSINVLRIVVLLGIIICYTMALVVTVQGAMNSLLCTSIYSIEEIQKDESIIDYISSINHYSYSEILSTMSNINNNVGFAVLEIIVPTIFTLIGWILLIISLKKILDLIKNATDSESLFTKDNNNLFTKIFLFGSIALLFLTGNFIIWLGIVTILEIIQYLFNYCVQITNDKK